MFVLSAVSRTGLHHDRSNVIWNRKLTRLKALINLFVFEENKLCEGPSSEYGAGNCLRYLDAADALSSLKHLSTHQRLSAVHMVEMRVRVGVNHELAQPRIGGPDELVSLGVRRGIVLAGLKQDLLDPRPLLSLLFRRHHKTTQILPVRVEKARTCDHQDNEDNPTDPPEIKQDQRDAEKPRYKSDCSDYSSGWSLIRWVAETGIVGIRFRDQVMQAIH